MKNKSKRVDFFQDFPANLGRNLRFNLDGPQTELVSQPATGSYLHINNIHNGISYSVGANQYLSLS
jgi:hypothetical protein